MRGEGGAKENENTKHERKMRNWVWRNRGSKQDEKKREERNASTLNAKFGKTKEKRETHGGK